MSIVIFCCCYLPLRTGTFKLISKCIDGKGFSGTKRYFGDLGKTVRYISFTYKDNTLNTLGSTIKILLVLQLRTAGSNVLFAVVTEISDSVLKGAETSGFNGMVQFILLLCRVIPAQSHINRLIPKNFYTLFS